MMFLFVIPLCSILFFGYALFSRRKVHTENVVMIESPYSGDIDRNIRYLSLAMSVSFYL